MVSEIGGIPPAPASQTFAAGMYLSAGTLHDPDDSYRFRTSGVTGAAPEIVTDVLYVQPFVPKMTRTFDLLGLRTVTTTHDSLSAVCKMGIYSFDLSTNRPTTLIAETAELTLAAANTVYSTAVGWTLYRNGVYAVVTTFDFAANNVVVYCDVKATNNAVGSGLVILDGSLTSSSFAVCGIQSRTYDATLPASYPAGTLTWTAAQLPPTAFMRVA